MLYLEYIKFKRKKIILLILLSSFLMSIFVYFSANRNMSYLINDKMSITSQTYFEEINLSDEKNKHLSEKDISDIYTKYEVIHNKFFKSEARKNLYTDKFDKYVLEEFTKIYNEYLNDLEKLRLEYNIYLDEEIKNSWDWTLFESDYMVNNKTYLNSVSYASRSRNFMRDIIFNSSTLFGIPLILILIFIFSSTIANEYERGTNNFIKLQGITKIKLYFTKLMIIIFSGILYITFSLIFLYIFYKISGIEWNNGHLEIYRIFSENNLDYISSSKLLLKIIAAAFIMIIFISNIIIFFSKITLNTNITFISLSSLIIILNILLAKFKIFRSIFNPIYALQYKENVLGYIDINKDIIIDEQIRTIESTGIQSYIFYIAMSLIIFALCIIIKFNENKYINCVKNKNIKNVFVFEMKKIYSEKSFKFSIISIILIILLVFLDISLKDLRYENLFYNNIMASYFENKISTEEENKSSLLNTMPAEEQNSQEDISIDNDKNILEYRKLYENALKAPIYFKNNNSKQYYSIFIDELKYNSEILNSEIEEGMYTSSSYIETQKIYDYMQEKEIKPIFINNKIFISSLENLSPSAGLFYKEDNLSDHSLSQIINRVFKNYSIDYILLILICIVISGGYIYDKENGNQISLIYTQPIKKSKYHFYKLMSAFLIAVFLIFLIFSAFLILGFIFGGIGDLNFPIIQYDKLIDKNNINSFSPDYFSIVPIYLYYIRIFILIIFQTLFLLSLGIMVSIFAKNRIQNSVINLSLLILGNIASKFLPENIKIFSPFIHLQASNIANGSIKIFENMQNTNIYTSISVLFVSSILIYILSLFIIKKRKILY